MADHPSAHTTTVGTLDDLHAAATRATGLTDFGEDSYLEPLRILLDSYAREAHLTPTGSKTARVFLKGALIARLLSEAAWQTDPGTPMCVSNARYS